MNKQREVPVRIVYRRKRGHTPHHGGAWKVAFADFMTAMFALFLVLWLVNQSSDVKSAIAGYFSDPLGRASEFGSSIMPGEGAQASSVRPIEQPQVTELRRDRMALIARHLEQRLDRVPELKDVRAFVEIQIAEDGLRIQLLEDSDGVFFETGVATPSDKGRRILALLGSELGRLSNRVRVEGHTDARPYSQQAGYTNWELSADRANAARRILTASGVADRRIVQIRGLADRDLRDASHPFADANRRVAITVLFDEGPPGVAAADSSAAAADTTAPVGEART